MTREVDYLRDELADIERTIRQKEVAPLEHRVVDADLWRDNLARLRAYRLRLRERIAEEEVLAGVWAGRA